MSIDKDHEIGQPQQPWPPQWPPDGAQEIAAKELFKRAHQYVRAQDPSDSTALRLLMPKHFCAYIGYDFDQNRLEVLIPYAMKVRHKIRDLEIDIDDRLPDHAVHHIINGMDPIDLPVIADSLVREYVDSLEELDGQIAILSNDSVRNADIAELRRQLLAAEKMMRKIHRQIRTGTLGQA